jgi:hypothetical protein
MRQFSTKSYSDGDIQLQSLGRSLPKNKVAKQPEMNVAGWTALDAKWQARQDIHQVAALRAVGSYRRSTFAGVGRIHSQEVHSLQRFPVYLP